MLTYNRYDIVFQEVPNETSLAFTIEGCPNRCEGCHSPHLREQNGEELTEELVLKLLNKYGKAITCVLFLGGDGFHKEIIELASICKSAGYKTAMYSGNDVLDEKLLRALDYYKVGSWKKELGGLSSKPTNQRMYRNTGIEIKDITGAFQNENNQR